MDDQESAVGGPSLQNSEDPFPQGMDSARVVKRADPSPLRVAV